MNLSDKYKEPVFRDLKIVISIYYQLNNDLPDQKKYDLIQSIYNILSIKPKSIWRLSTDELSEFIQNIPAICGLSTSEHSSQKSAHNPSFDPQVFSEIYGALANAFGYTYHYIDEQLTYSKAKELFDYLKVNPPANLLIAAWVGYEPPLSTEQQIKKLFSSFSF